MAQKNILNGSSGKTVREAINDNFTELYRDKANTNHASSTSNFGAASTTMFGHIKIADGGALTISNGVLSLATASTSQATSGTANNVVMTPARVKEAVNAYGVMSDGNTIIKIGGSQPTPQAGKDIIWIDTTS